VRDLDPGGAVRWYEIAADVTVDPETRRQLLAGAAEARSRIAP
jgi:hypothetical protein